MKKINIKHYAKILFSLALALFLFSCDKELTDDSFATEDVLTVTVSNPDVILEERYTENKVTINWTTGSNKDTGSSISYLLEIDKAGNNFSMPLTYDMGKNQFLFSYNYKTLNQILLNTFNALPNTATELEARVTAIFADGSISPQIATTTFMVTPYQPVSSQLFIVGSATPIG
ncbi:MAG: SusE domain-containing protein, partial [Candidatus Magasanikbacteria bacterium]|nr:SusE domain-containing protein [Candidatus Magasanikbacteria bacterium]